MEGYGHFAYFSAEKKVGVEATTCLFAGEMSKVYRMLRQVSWTHRSSNTKIYKARGKVFSSVFANRMFLDDS